MKQIEELLDLSEDVSRHLLSVNKDGGLEMIRGIPGIVVHARGNRLSLVGSDEGIKLVKRFLKILTRRLESGDEPEPREVRYLFDEVAQSGEKAREEPFNEIISTHSGRSIRAKTFNQQSYIDTMQKHDITISIGPAGTGKTFLAIAMAVRALREKQVTRLILSRPTIEAGEKLGFLPGDILEKVDPHFRPLYDALQEFLGISRFQQLLRQGVIEITPLGFMRGRTFNEAFILLDEAQNTTIKQMRMFLTRMGYGSKVVVTGDQTQIDLPDPQTSSLLTLKEVLGEIEKIAFVSLSYKDVVRHELVKEIIQAYETFFGEGGKK